MTTTTTTVTCDELRSVLLDWQRDPARAAQARAIGYALDALATSDEAPVAVAADGNLDVRGRSGWYRVERAGLGLACSCPHGQRGGRGTCYHLILADAFAEARERRADERDAAAERAALPFEVGPGDLADDEYLELVAGDPEPWEHDWREAEMEGWAMWLAAQVAPRRAVAA